MRIVKLPRECINIERIEIPLVYGKNLTTGEVIGPCITAVEAGRRAKIKGIKSVSNVLRNKSKSSYNWTFWYEGVKVITLEYPNISEILYRGLLKRPNDGKFRHTKESIEFNVKQCGYNLIEIDKFEGNKSKLKVTCCCCKEEVIEIQYNNIINHQNIPLCKDCRNILNTHRSLGRKMKSKKMANVRDDLKEKYIEGLNENIKWEDISSGSSKKIKLQCEVCQNIDEFITKHLCITDKKGSFYSSGKCSRCNSLGMWNNGSLLKEWSNNNKEDPFTISYGSEKAYLWICEEHGEYEQSVKNKTVIGVGCPSCRSFKMEKIGREILLQMGINFSEQQKFSELIDNGYLRFDFTIFRNMEFAAKLVLNNTNEILCFIEVDGEFHFQEIMNHDLEGQQRRDRIKDEFCIDKNIPLLRIHYRDIEKIPKLISTFVGKCSEGKIKNIISYSRKYPVRFRVNKEINKLRK